jgi:Bacterial Ig domain
VRLGRLSRLKCVLCFAIVLSPAILATPPSFAETSAPTLVSSLGYINRKPIMSHTTASFNSSGASTILVFISSHPFWSDHPVTIAGLRDNAGNSWKTLESPTPWVGSSFTLLSAIYYVNAPITSLEHQLTVDLSNPAPLVLHLIAVSGSDITAPPIHSRINSLPVGAKSVEVMAQPIAVPEHTLLLAWAKNESNARASSVDGYTLDGQSTPFLWGESKIALADGSYTSHFRYDTATGYQTVVVGIRKATLPLAISQSIKTSGSTPVNISLSTSSPKGLPFTYRLTNAPIHGKLSGSFPRLTYTPDTGYVGSDKFTFQANDGNSDTNIASIGISVEKKTLIQGLDGTATRIGAFSILSVAIFGIKQLLCRQSNFARC